MAERKRGDTLRQKTSITNVIKYAGRVYRAGDRVGLRYRTGNSAVLQLLRTDEHSCVTDQYDSLRLGRKQGHGRRIRAAIRWNGSALSDHMRKNSGNVLRVLCALLPLRRSVGDDLRSGGQHTGVLRCELLRRRHFYGSARLLCFCLWLEETDRSGGYDGTIDHRRRPVRCDLHNPAGGREICQGYLPGRKR